MKIDPKILDQMKHEKNILKRLMPSQDLETEFEISKDQVKTFEQRAWRLFKTAYENKVIDLSAKVMPRPKKFDKKAKAEAPVEPTPTPAPTTST